MLKLILKYRPNMDYLYDYDLNSTVSSILSIAITEGYSSKVIALLLESGAKVKELKGETAGEPLMTALYYDREELLPLLLDHGGDINCLMKFADHEAEVEEIRMDLIHMIIISEDPADDIRTLKVLIKRGIKFNKKGDYIIMAKNEGKDELVGFLEEVMSSISL